MVEAIVYFDRPVLWMVVEVLRMFTGIATKVLALYEGTLFFLHSDRYSGTAA